MIHTSLERAQSVLRGQTDYVRHDAIGLMCHLLGKNRAWLLAHPDAALSPEQQAHYDALLARRAAHEPMQYILGEQEFYGLRLRVTPAVLIPRPETEHLVEAVLARLPHDRQLRIADVGTGSGAIAIAIAHSLPQAHVDALDISADALAVARHNAEAHGVTPRVRLLCSDLLESVAGETYDAIVSNPPYVAEGEPLEPQVAEWEPHTALFAGEDGLAIYRRLLPQAFAALAPEGLLALEHGCGQHAALCALMQANRGWSESACIRDLQGHERVLLATKLSAEG